MLLMEFTPHAIEALASLLESCGRYLYLTPEAHHRCVKALATMMRLKSAKMLDKTTESIIDNAFYQCKPPERVARQEEVLPPLHQYVIHLFSLLDDDNTEEVLKQVPYRARRVALRRAGGTNTRALWDFVLCWPYGSFGSCHGARTTRSSRCCTPRFCSRRGSGTTASISAATCWPA